MSRHGTGAAAAAGFGVGFLLAGTAMLFQEFDLLSLRWSFVLPLIVIMAGAAVVFSGVIGAHRSRPTNGATQSGRPLDDPSGYRPVGGATATSTGAQRDNT